MTEIATSYYKQLQLLLYLTESRLTISALNYVYCHFYVLPPISILTRICWFTTTSFSPSSRWAASQWGASATIVSQLLNIDGTIKNWLRFIKVSKWILQLPTSFWSPVYGNELFTIFVFLLSQHSVWWQRGAWSPRSARGPTRSSSCPWSATSLSLSSRWAASQWGASATIVSQLLNIDGMIKNWLRFIKVSKWILQLPTSFWSPVYHSIQYGGVEPQASAGGGDQVSGHHQVSGGVHSLKVHTYNINL